LQEWNNALRSAIHPAIFATVYYLANLVAEVFRLTPGTRADLLLAAPKILQGVFAALGDYYTWKLARRVFGHESQQAWAALALTVLSPWQWFCSTRTLSNCLETTLTIAALYNWPWQWSLTDRHDARYDRAGLRVREDAKEDAVDEMTRLRRSLLLAALATILRPTNLLIWITLAAMTSMQMSSGGWFARIPWVNQRILVEFTSPALLRATSRELRTLMVESVLCGSTILILSLLVDRFYYQSWTFPPLKFIYFNVVQSLSVFYGRNDWHYYLSQGFPLLLTTALPFAMIGLYRGLFSAHSTETPLTAITLSQLATIACAVPAALSLISHKEVRFVYPLLPLLHILAAEPLVQFFAPSLIHPFRSRRAPPYAFIRRLILGLLILLNASIAIYTTTIHGRGVIDVLTYLRHQHESYYRPPHHNPDSNPISNPNLTAAFLMPCHSTPWRSHLIHPTISAWALTCEPPLHLSSTEKETYVDEADAFYADPSLWLRRNMSRHPPSPARGGIFTTKDKQQRHGSRERGIPNHDIDRRRSWPDYLIFFAAAEKTMETALRGSGYVECWRGFNSHWHDDRRRSGDVVAWCLFAERSLNLPEKARREGLRVPGVPGSREREHRDSTLGGAKGPWGVGVGMSRHGNGNEGKASATTTTTGWRWRWWGSGQEGEKQTKMKTKPRTKAKKQQAVWS
jgi:GPI mannosyltransferase 3